MDWGSLAGLVLALTGILVGQAIEGGKISSLLQPTAFCVVVFGTAGAVLLQTKLSHFLQGLKMLVWIFKPPEDNRQMMAKKIGVWSLVARRDGMLKLENHFNNEQDPFVKKGLRLMIDGIPPQKIEEIFGIELDTYEANQRNAAKIWDAAGGYAPTVGILGAVLGLIHVMENLSDPAVLGSGIAVSFVATIYGVGLANLVFLPISYKLRSHIQTDLTNREMIVDAMVCIANGEHPRLVEERMASYDS